MRLFLIELLNIHVPRAYAKEAMVNHTTHSFSPSQVTIHQICFEKDKRNNIVN
jgi:hypothetical protein